MQKKKGGALLEAKARFVHHASPPVVERVLPHLQERERIFIELMTSDLKLKTSKGSK